MTPAEAVELVDAGAGAVESAMVADVPVGSLLSGGVDSSLIVALAAARSDSPIETFSAGFGDPRFDELPFARQVSEAFGTNHHEVELRPEDFVDQWRRLTWFRDAPMSEPADVAVFELAQLARQSVKVLLSGEGSRLFAGYPKYRMARVGGLADSVPASIGPHAGRGRQAAAGPRRPGAWRPGPLGSHRGRSGGLVVRAVHAGRAGQAARRRLRPASAEALRGDSAIQRMLAHDCQGWLADNLLSEGDRWPWPPRSSCDRRSSTTTWSSWPPCRRE